MPGTLRKSFQRKRFGDLSVAGVTKSLVPPFSVSGNSKGALWSTNSKKQHEEAGLGGTRGHPGFAKVITL